jgi:predicted aspartyl protease
MATVSGVKQKESGVGTVFADIVVSNHRDEIKAEEGSIAQAAVRSLSLDSVLVDTGAMTLCLPGALVRQLGLPFKRRVFATTAGGEIEAEVYSDATVTVGDRSTVVECLALPDGARPLLGAVPMEMTGLEPDLVNRVLRVLPDDNKDTYILAY